MKTILFLTILISMLSLNLNGKAQSYFQKTYAGVGYDRGNSVQQTSDGGYIVAGVEFSFGAGDGDVFLIKTDANGDTLWTRSFGGTGDDYGESVKQTTDGGYVVVGYTNSFGQGLDDVYLIKTDSNGNALWTKTYGGTNYDFGVSVQQTIDGGYIVGGSTSSFGAGYNDVYLIKTNSIGDTLWTKTLGGTGYDEAASIQQTDDGGYIIAGTTYFSFGNGDYSAYLNRTDAYGNILWTKTYNTAGSQSVRSMQLTKDGGFIVAGEIRTGPSNTYFSVFKTDENGVIIWAKNYSGGGSNSVQQTSDGGYVIAGYSDDFVSLFKTDSVGDTIWTKVFKGNNNYAYGNFVQQTTDNGFIVTGYTHNFSAGDPVYLIKTDSNGNSCIQSNLSTTITTPVYTVNTPVSLVSHGGIIGSPATINNRGGDIFDICSHVGIETHVKSESSFIIFPNPFSSETTLQTEKLFNKAILTVRNSQGEVVRQIKNIFGQTITIHLDNLPSGLYFLQMTQESKNYDTKKIIITDN